MAAMASEGGGALREPVGGFDVEDLVFDFKTRNAGFGFSAQGLQKPAAGIRFVQEGL
jgi:hypothetical protein